MTNTKPQCCEKCDTMDARFNMRCSNFGCPCHTKPQHEGWEAEFDDEFDCHWNPEETVKGTRDEIKSFIHNHIEVAQEDMRRKCLDEKRISIGMMNGWYFKKPEEGFDGTVQYIPKHEVLNIISPERALDKEGNRIEAITPSKD